MISLIFVLLLLFLLPVVELYLFDKYNLFNLKIEKKSKYIILNICITYLLIRGLGVVGLVSSIPELLQVVQNRLIFVIITLILINGVFVAVTVLIKKYIQFACGEKDKRKFIILTGVFLILSLVIIMTLSYIKNTFGGATAQQIMFNLLAPVEGASKDEFMRVIINPLLNGIAISIIIITLLTGDKTVCFGKLSISSKKINRCFLVLSCVLLIFSLVFMNKQIKLIDYIVYTNSESSFIEEEYVSPNDVEITLNGGKRNMIHIYMESMESSFASKEDGGLLDDNLINGLTSLAKDNYSFSDKADPNRIGGAACVEGTSWTSGGMTATELGLPLKINGMLEDINSYGQEGNFMNGAIGLGNILEASGYKNVFLLGSQANFGGRDALMKNHGNYEIIDLDKLKENGFIPQDYNLNWGMEDQKVFDYAKEELDILSSTDQPFNLTLLTSDTHAPYGYYDEENPEITGVHYYDSLIYNDQMITDFVEWCEEQDWYENTTIVLTGDHTTMNNQTFSEEYERGYNPNEPKEARRIYNAFINAQPTNDKVIETSRTFTTMDYMPTILGALGYDIEGDRLGLGTNLFSETKTLAEEFGLEKLDKEIRKKSPFYNEEFLYQKQIRKYNGSKLIIDGQPSE